MLKKVQADELLIDFFYEKSTEQVEPAELFPGQKRVERAFDLALSTVYEGYNIFVSGPESVGRTVYTLKRLREVAKERIPPEDVCYVNNFDNPLRPRYLLLPAGMGKMLSQDVDIALETLKDELPKAFESKEYEEEVTRINKLAEIQKEEVIKELTEEAQRHNLGVVFTPAGIKLFPIVGKRIITEKELLENERLQESYERDISKFEERFIEFTRTLRGIEHGVIEKILDLRKKVANYVTDKVFSRFEERYKTYREAYDFLKRLKEEIVKNTDLFMLWHSAKGNIAMMKGL
ncbi:MAG: Lon-like protease helical domain-containing protein, partial [Aquificaceae bacterium]